MLAIPQDSKSDVHQPHPGHRGKDVVRKLPDDLGGTQQEQDGQQEPH